MKTGTRIAGLRPGSLLRFALTVTLFVLILRSTDLGETWRAIRGARFGLFALAIAISFLDRLVMIAKWLPLARVHVPDIDSRRAGKVYLASGLAGLLLPASVGGDVIRIVAMGAGGASTTGVTASVLVERLLGFLGLGILSLLSLFFAVRAHVELRFLLPLCLLAVAIPLAVLSIPHITARWTGSSPFRIPGWMAGIGRFGTAFSAYRDHGATLFAVGGISFLEQLFPVGVNWLLARSLSLDVTLGMLVVAVPLTVFVSRLPITVWGLGATEGSLVYLLGLFGVDAAGALALALIGRVTSLLMVLPGAAFLGELVRVDRTRVDVEP